MVKGRSLKELIFGKEKQKNITKTQLELLNSYNAIFSTVSENLYNNNIARECIDTIATHCAKLIPRHIKGNITNHINGDINYLLSVQPNPIMCKYDFIYRIISMLYTDNNAFVFISYDETGMIQGFYPVLANTYEFLQTKDGIILLQFQFINGKTYTLPYEELIHLRRFYNKHDLFGSNNKVIHGAIETATTANEGIKNAIRTSNSVKGIIKYTNSMLKDKDIKENRDQFVNDFVNAENESGIASLDAKADFQEVNLKPIALDKEQLEQVNYNIFDYFRINENIVRSKFTADEWNAFYESVIEPLAIQLSDVFTIKIFNKKSIKAGNKIVFTANRLQYASLDSKIKLLKEAGALGLMKKDEAREIIDLAPIGGEEGEKIIQSLNNIDSKIANQYQGGESNGKSD